MCRLKSGMCRLNPYEAPTYDFFSAESSAAPAATWAPPRHEGAVGEGQGQGGAHRLGHGAGGLGEARELGTGRHRRVWRAVR